MRPLATPLSLAALRDLPTRHLPTVDGRRIGVAACTLTCGADVAALVPADLLDAFETARADLAATPGGQYRLTLAERPDGRLELHAVDTAAVMIDAGRCSTGAPIALDDVVGGIATAAAAIAATATATAVRPVPAMAAVATRRAAPRRRAIAA